MSVPDFRPSRSQSTNQIQQKQIQNIFDILDRPGPPPPNPAHFPGLTIKTCQIKSDYTPERDFFRSDDDFKKTISVKAGVLGFEIGKPQRYFDTDLVSVLFSYGDGKENGYVPVKYIISGTGLRKVTIDGDFVPNLRSTSITNPGGNEASVLRKTLYSLLGEMVARIDTLINMGCQRSTLTALARDPNFFRQELVNGMSAIARHW